MPRIAPLIALLLALATLTACGDDPAPPTTTDADTGALDASDDTTPDDDATPDDATEDTTPDVPPPVVPPLRPAGTRAPLTALCDPVDTTACLLPWPSDTFTEADPTTPTGLRIHIDADAFYPHDDPASYHRATGHSRISPIVTAVPLAVDTDALGDGIDGAIRVIVAEPGAHLGEQLPLRYLAVPEPEVPTPSTTLVAYPRVSMRPATEYVVVLLDTLHDADGASLPQEPLAAASLGLAEPTTQAEADLYAYHAPARDALIAAGIAPEHVTRLWSFTTRSLEEPLVDLDAARRVFLDAVDAGAFNIALDSVTLPPDGPVGAIVQGRLTGLPRVATVTELISDADGLPTADGTREVPFRVAIPRGEGDYRIVMYAHGMGGDVSDPAFDTVITSEGAAKVGIQFDDWTTPGLAQMAGALGATATATGSDRLAAHLIENLAGAMAVQRALAGRLGDLLAADSLNGQPNPLAGRRPDPERAVWAGGSLGGTTGMVYATASPDVAVAVLNVPGAGYSHFLRFSELYGVLGLLLKAYYPSQADIHLAIAMAQLNLDTADGAVFIDATPYHPTLLIQESVGDPILPNIGTDLAAADGDARYVGAVIHPIWGLTPAEGELVGQTAITQYRVDATESLAIHGFAERQTPPGNAAQEQIRVFIRSYWADGTPRVIVPTPCVDNDPPSSCDFRP